MRSKLNLAVLLVAGVLASIQLTGCTVVGLVAGAASSEKAKTVSGWEMADLKAGRRVRLEMKSDSTIETVYRGVFVYPVKQYAARYTNWLQEQPDRSPFPPFESTVTVTPDTGETITGAFLGFDRDRILVRSPGSKIATKLSEVLWISTETGDVLAGSSIVAMVMDGDVPHRQQYSFDGAHGARLIDARDVRDAYAYPKNNAGTWMLGGMAVDVWILGFVARTWK